MKTSKKYVLLIAIIVLLLVVGYSRDFIFKSINALIKAREAEMEYYLNPLLSSFEKFSTSFLVKLKWILTIGFSGIYLLISIWSIKLIFNKSKYWMVVVYVYFLVVATSAFFILYGYIVKTSSETMYEFARYFMGMAQSPIILMLLIPAFKLKEVSAKQ